MANSAFPPVLVNFDADKLASEFTLIAGQINAASHAEKVASRRRQAPRGDDAEAELEHQAAGEAMYFQDDEGMWIIQATLPEEAGASLIKAIEAVAATMQEDKQTRKYFRGNASPRI